MFYWRLLKYKLNLREWEEFLLCFLNVFEWISFQFNFNFFSFSFSQLRETISSVTLASKHVPAHWLKLTERNVFDNFGVEQQQQTSNWKWNWNLNIKLKMKLKLKHQIETETHCYWNLKHQTKTLVNVQNNKPKNTFLRFIRDKQDQHKNTIWWSYNCLTKLGSLSE